MTEAAPMEQLPHRGVLVFVLGILGLGVFFLFGTVAWSMGNRHLAQMDEGARDASGRGMTAAGKVLGMSGVILTVLALLFILVV